jgi:peptidoglycan/LPS O-acetylase OafA/YrhL
LENLRLQLATIIVVVGIVLAVVSPALTDGSPTSARSFVALLGAALMIAGMYLGAPAPPRILGNKPVS